MNTAKPGIFTPITKDRLGKARTGVVSLAHGTVHTPAFMPVGTSATVKAVSHSSLREIGSEIILANTYHLIARPGVDIIASHGGLHDFMSWDKPVLTDSGGFQVFSLNKLRKISEEGVSFRDPYDGRSRVMTPESAILDQQRLGADIIMAFDECTPYPASYEQAQQSMLLSMRWARRCAQVHTSTNSQLFGIVQGGMFRALRTESLERLVDIGFVGYAMGGLSVGEPKEHMYEVLDYLPALLPENSPRYLMGVGTPQDIVTGVANGVDMFDCVMPTRNARNGHLFTSEGIIRIGNARFAKDTHAIDNTCSCPCCQNYSRAYMHHLKRCKELLYYQLASIHNLAYYLNLMQSIRDAINTNTFSVFQKEFHRTYPLKKH